MKTNDYLFGFSPQNIHPIDISFCRVREFIRVDGEYIILLSELEENNGCSIINSIETIIEQMNPDLLSKSDLRIFSHLPEYNVYGRLIRDIIQEVVFEGGVPKWFPELSLGYLIDYLQCSEDEFSDYKDDNRLIKEIEKYVQKNTDRVKPLVHEPDYIVRRRGEIASNQISKSEIQMILDHYPSEQEMQKVLEQDLSLIAENYANPPEEYIAFPQFPIGDGYADFVLFTCRSRMEVIIFEIKDAKQHILRENYYSDFRQRYQEGISQLDCRYQYCIRNYGEFRSKVHTMRQEVIAVAEKERELPYRAFPGPKYTLKVDPNKNITMRYVFIGGRTINDIKDSEIRNNKENAANYSLKIETWDSWLNKLRRN